MTLADSGRVFSSTVNSPNSFEVCPVTTARIQKADTIIKMYTKRFAKRNLDTRLPFIRTGTG